MPFLIARSMFSFGIELPLRRVDRRAQSRVSVGIAAAQLGGHRDLADELREQRAALRVSRRLVVLDLLPFTVASHKQLGRCGDGSAKSRKYTTATAPDRRPVGASAPIVATASSATALPQAASRRGRIASAQESRDRCARRTRGAPRRTSMISRASGMSSAQRRAPSGDTAKSDRPGSRASGLESQAAFLV